MPHLATLDLGNSALSVCRWEFDAPLARLVEHVRFDARRSPESALEAWLAERDIEEALFSWVAADAAARPIAALLSARLGDLAHLQPRAAIENLCRPASSTGVDRLHAARGAYELGRRCAIVVDAGTALTVDALEVADPDRRPRFLGGAIAAGPDLAARALGGGAARLFRVRPRAGARALGRNTEEALVAGVTLGFAGAARELVRRVGREARLEDAPVFLTGGAAELLFEPGLFEGHPVRHEPALVHVGLLAARPAGPPERYATGGEDRA